MTLHPYIGIGPAIRKHSVPIYYPPRRRMDFRDPLSEERTETVRVLGHVKGWAVITSLPKRPNEIPTCVPDNEIFIDLTPQKPTENQQCRK